MVTKEKRGTASSQAQPWARGKISEESSAGMQAAAIFHLANAWHTSRQQFSVKKQHSLHIAFPPPTSCSAATTETHRCNQDHDRLCKDKNPWWGQNYNNPHHSINIFTTNTQQTPPHIITPLPYLDSGHTDTPWAGEQVHKHSLEVVRKDKDHLEVVEEEEHSLPAQVHTLQEQVHSHLEQVGQGHTLQVQVCIHSQGAGEELHWKLKSTYLLSQTSFCCNWPYGIKRK